MVWDHAAPVRQVIYHHWLIHARTDRRLDRNAPHVSVETSSAKRYNFGDAPLEPGHAEESAPERRLNIDFVDTLLSTQGQEHQVSVCVCVGGGSDNLLMRIKGTVHPITCSTTSQHHANTHLVFNRIESDNSLYQTC